jgi:hypothetical protein
MMLTPTVAQLITEDRIREAEAWRLARTARPARARTAGALRLRRPAWAYIRPHAGASPR